MKVAKAYASLHHLTLGEAVSELVCQADELPLETDARNGIQVVRLRRPSPEVTTALVDELRDDLAAIVKHHVLLARQAKAMVAEQANYY